MTSFMNTAKRIKKWLRVKTFSSLSLLSDYIVKWRTPPSFSCSYGKKNPERKKNLCPGPVLIIFSCFWQFMHKSCINLQPASSCLNFYFLRFFWPQERSTTLKEPLIWIGKYLHSAYIFIFWKDFTVIHLFCFFLQSFTLSEALLLIRWLSCEVAIKLAVFIWQFPINASR